MLNNFFKIKLSEPFQTLAHLRGLPQGEPDHQCSGSLGNARSHQTINESICDCF